MALRSARALFLLCSFFLLAGAKEEKPTLCACGSIRNKFQTLQFYERKVPGIIKGAEARFHFPVSFDTPGYSGFFEPTDRALVYLHGFSASPAETYPLVENLSRRFTSNAYFVRYAGHGLEGPDGMKAVRAETWATETERVLDEGRKIGKKLVVLATSTGASLALPQAIANPEKIEALVLMSPNFGLKAKSTELLLLPRPLAWLLGAAVMGPYREFEPINPRQALWWTYRYPFTAVLEMMRAVDAARKARLEDLKVPVLVLYSERDDVVSLEKMREAFARIGSAKKEMREIKSAENDHVLAGVTLSPSGTKEVAAAIVEFLGK